MFNNSKEDFREIMIGIFRQLKDEPFLLIHRDGSEEYINTSPYFKIRVHKDVYDRVHISTGFEFYNGDMIFIEVRKLETNKKFHNLKGDIVKEACIELSDYGNIYGIDLKNRNTEIIRLTNFENFKEDFWNFAILLRAISNVYKGGNDV